MAELTESKVLEAVDKLKATFADGLQISDLSVVLEEIVVFADLFTLEGEEKKALALRVAEKVIDDTDTPWLPDPLTDPLIKKFLPSLIDLVIKANNGEMALKKKS